MATRKVTFDFNAIAFTTPEGTQQDANAIAYLIQTKLQQQGWSVISCVASPVGTAYYHVILNVNLDTAFDGESTNNRYLPSALAPDFTISNGVYTDSLQQTGGTNINNNQQPIVHMNNPNGQYVATVNGFDIYKDSQGCYYYDDALGYVPTTCPAPDFLTQIGNALGFNNPNKGLGKSGLTAAAGGAIALIVIALIITSRK